MPSSLNRRCAGVAFLVAAACGPARQESATQVGARAVDDAALRSADGRIGDWLSHGRTYAEQRFSPLDQIDAGNVGELGLLWAFETGTRRGLEATPIVVDGVLFTTGSWSVVYAVDARTGESLWKWDPEVPRSVGQKACCDVVNRGVAVYQGKVYAGILDGRLAALDAETGVLLWEVVTVDQSQPYTITGAPRVVKGNVIIGNGGAEFGVRGYVSAYDAETGDLTWRFYTVPGDPTQPFESAAMEKAAETWNGEWWRFGGGGTVWDSLAYDPELDLLYVGTGNGTPWNQQIRSPGGGDNLYLCSILALRPETGELVWHYQTTPGESWDYTATQHMILADLQIDGVERRVLMQAPKNGFFYVLDRATGELLSAEPFTDVTWASHVDPQTGRPVEAPESRYLEKPTIIRPTPFGGHNWHPMAFNPATGLVYIPAASNAMVYRRDPGFLHRPGAYNLGIQHAPEIPTGIENRGMLLAWDPVQQLERWRVEHERQANGGALTTAGNLVFQGTADGRFVAYGADDGRKLWEMQVGSGIVAAPVSYLVDGGQRVSVMAGWGGSSALVGQQGAVAPGRLLTFSLGGEAQLPESAEAPAPALQPIAVTASAEEVTEGNQLYHAWCRRCHGFEAAGGGVISDLRYSSPAMLDAYPAIVLQGIMVDAGMPSFERWLNEDEVAAIRSYVLDRRAAIDAQ